MIEEKINGGNDEINIEVVTYRPYFRMSVNGSAFHKTHDGKGWVKETSRRWSDKTNACATGLTYMAIANPSLREWLNAIQLWPEFLIRRTLWNSFGVTRCSTYEIILYWSSPSTGQNRISIQRHLSRRSMRGSSMGSGKCARAMGSSCYVTDWMTSSSSSVSCEGFRESSSLLRVHARKQVSRSSRFVPEDHLGFRGGSARSLLGAKLQTQRSGNQWHLGSTFRTVVQCVFTVQDEMQSPCQREEYSWVKLWALFG